ncbi:Radical SAM superfamily enzyme, MoaA/NifB/PqqE/SkfB family [Clostridium cadaveris]|uniref:Radical SAM superfamily enzyme, MoaA/NifB/PqqE/SkfB family n=1 Tax=Clostridium cadaveris TaxID=1529 RepID=A0A1I2M9E5_9CLOT|nr:radical SAM protein [Clostridium cadaveris]MDM8313506.1 radical SAM protein [Clostridium cadaveris]SFF87550.1 Radical SAM superfamily enzyme, MoaA/NifB/PqqE/SkfB family [Clostridium cadaveris]
MSKEFNLSEYMSEGIENIVNSVLKLSIKNPKEAIFVMKYMLAVKDAKNKRNMLESKGEHIPPFLMVSIATNCNLHCKGCYARANKSCGNNLKASEISEERWGEIFNEAKEVGISFSLLLGGEPLMRRGVIEKASSVKEIVFPIFTNGTMIDESYINLFDKNRNLVPMISIEGDKSQTDERRGEGTYNSIIAAMNSLNKKGILFGGSVTVTTENILTVTSKEFVQNLYDRGTRVLIFVEYVPVINSTRNIALTDKERLILEDEIEELRKVFKNMIFLSFPGDEKYSGGCLAAGRGFFHINANGGAEPCPFSPYSDINLKECSLREALKSPLFKKLKDNEMLLGEHDGGCLLFEKEDDVKELLGI